MHGLITQFLVLPEQQGPLMRILAAGTQAMPGCLAYVVAEDASREDAVWVTEVWADTESHAASLGLPAVREAMAQGRPLVTGMGTRVATRPVASA